MTQDSDREALRQQAVRDLQGLRQRLEEIETSTPHAAHTRVPPWERAVYTASIHKLQLAEAQDRSRYDIVPEPPLVRTTLGQPDDSITVWVLLRRVRWVLALYGAV